MRSRTFSITFVGLSGWRLFSMGCSGFGCRFSFLAAPIGSSTRGGRSTCSRRTAETSLSLLLLLKLLFPCHFLFTSRLHHLIHVHEVGRHLVGLVLGTLQHISALGLQIHLLSMLLLFNFQPLFRHGTNQIIHTVSVGICMTYFGFQLANLLGRSARTAGLHRIECSLILGSVLLHILVHQVIDVRRRIIFPSSIWLHLALSTFFVRVSFLGFTRTLFDLPLGWEGLFGGTNTTTRGLASSTRNRFFHQTRIYILIGIAMLGHSLRSGICMPSDLSTAILLLLLIPRRGVMINRSS